MWRDLHVLQRLDELGCVVALVSTQRDVPFGVDLASIGHPVVCDPLYGDKKFNAEFREKYGLKRQFLHAARVEIDGKVYEAQLPEDLQKLKLA